jgi:hypothetical protein
MNRFLVLFYSLSAAYSIVVLAVNSYRGCSVISRRLGSRIQRLERLERFKRLEPSFSSRGTPTTVAGHAGDLAAGSSE